MTRTEARSIGVATSEILRAAPEVTPAEIAERAANHRLRFRWTLTANSLAKYWSQCATAPSSPNGQGYEPFAPPEPLSPAEQDASDKARAAAFAEYRGGKS